MAIMTYTELNNSLTAIQIAQPNYNVFIFDFFTNLYNTGVRPEELLHYGYWNFEDADTVKLNTLKDNLPRYFDQATLTQDFKNSIKGNYNSYLTDNIKKMQYFFKKWYLYSQVKVGEKESVLYLFRYRYVKGLKLSGMSNADIANDMGWTSQAMVVRYVNADIEY